MSWELGESTRTRTYKPDERWECEVVERCNEGDKSWSIHLIYDDEPRFVIEDGLESETGAINRMEEWIAEHPVIIS